MNADSGKIPAIIGTVYTTLTPEANKAYQHWLTLKVAERGAFEVKQLPCGSSCDLFVQLVRQDLDAWSWWVIAECTAGESWVATGFETFAEAQEEFSAYA